MSILGQFDLIEKFNLDIVLPGVCNVTNTQATYLLLVTLLINFMFQAFISRVMQLLGIEFEHVKAGLIYMVSACCDGSV